MPLLFLIFFNLFFKFYSDLKFQKSLFKNTNMCSIGGKIFITSVFLVIIFEFEVVSCPRPGSGRVQVNFRAKLIIRILRTLIFRFEDPLYSDQKDLAKV